MANDSAPSSQDWRRHMVDYNEGLGLVYERIVLNEMLNRLVDRHGIRTVLEAPIYGMAGVSGINSVALAQRGAEVTLVDCDPERLEAVRRVWTELTLDAHLIFQGDFSSLPFEDRQFDMVWNWAALWHIADPESLLRELARITGDLIFVAMPNRVQVGYILRKFVLERGFTRYVKEEWADIRRVKSALKGLGVRIIEEGVLDVPPWPDTVMPAAQVLHKFGIRAKRFSGSQWNWSTMDYYLGRRPELKPLMERYAFLEHSPVPWQIKSVWAHHRYVVGQVD